MSCRSLNAILAISLSLVVALAAVRGQAEPAPPSPAFVGGKTCATCHAAEAEAWTGSHHDLAMQEATADTVLGDFDDATFTRFGVTSRFFRKDGAFFVNTEGPDGAFADFEIAYTFGADPLQQTGDLERALTVLKETHARHPNDRSVLFGLGAMSREKGDRAAAIRYATRLTEIAPRDPQAREFLKQLEAEGR